MNTLMAELSAANASLAEARKVARKAAAAVRKAAKAAAAAKEAAVADGRVMCIDGTMYMVKDTNVYDYNEITDVVGDFVGRLNPDKTIDTDGDEAEEFVDLLGLDTVPISTTASTQIHDDLLGIDFASVSTAEEEEEAVPSSVRKRYNRNPADYLAVGQPIYFNYCGVVEYAAVWDGTHFVLQDLAVAGANARVKSPSTFAGRILTHLIWTGVAWHRKTASANGWMECYVKVDGMPVKLRDLALRA
jgi:hypothetical protein